jgi:5'-3' exoribonuclease 1
VDSRFQNLSAPLKYEAFLVKGVSRQSILKPLHAQQRLSKQNFKLGDRVIYVLDSGVVPLAAKGTVVGLQEGFLDILFDHTFMGGLDLDGR